MYSKRSLPILFLVSLLAVWLYACDSSGPVEPASAAEPADQEAPNPAFAKGEKKDLSPWAGFVGWTQAYVGNPVTIQAGTTVYLLAAAGCPENYSVPVSGGWELVDVDGTPYYEDLQIQTVRNHPSLASNGPSAWRAGIVVTNTGTSAANVEFYSHAMCSRPAPPAQ